MYMKINPRFFDILMFHTANITFNEEIHVFIDYS